MSELSGSLEDFPLPDVLRLLSRGTKLGVLHVYGDVVRGRVYLEEGSISYATTRSTDDFAEGGSSSTGARPDGGERRRTKLDEVNDEDPELFSEMLKQQITEVLVRLARETSGSFVFQNGVTPQEPVKEPFAVDEILAGAEAELNEWQRIETIIGTTSHPMTIVVPLEEGRKIALSSIEWNTVAVLATTASTREVADRLEIFEIDAARTVARLVEEGLVEPMVDPKAARQSDPVDASERTPEPEAPAVAEPVATELADDDVDDDDEPELSETETREVFSALTQRDDAPVADLAQDDEADEAPEDDEEGEDDEQPPASELARRWRNLRAAGAGE